jgi:hypothetical protein
VNWNPLPEGRGQGEGGAVMNERDERKAKDKREPEKDSGAEASQVRPISIREWLLSDKARGELNIPDRKHFRMRPSPDFSED